MPRPHVLNLLNFKHEVRCFRQVLCQKKDFWPSERCGLAEEAPIGFRIPNRSRRRLFLEVHGDLLSRGYWERLQRGLGAGYVPSIRVHPESSGLGSAGTE